MMTADLLGRVAEYLSANPTASGGQVARVLGVRRKDALAAVSLLKAAGVVASTDEPSEEPGTGSPALVACPACGVRLDLRVGRAL